MKKNNNKGFTLLEVLLSIIVVGLVLVCVIVLNNASSSASATSKMNANIASAVNKTLDEFSSNPQSIVGVSGETYKIYYSADFSAKVEMETANYIYVEGSILSPGAHYTAYQVTLTVYTSDSADEPYSLYNNDSFYRVARVEA